MAEFLERLLIVFSVASLAFIYSILSQYKAKSKENMIFCIYCVGSAIWSFCFGQVAVQTVPHNAYIWRSLGMVGTFTSLIMTTFFITRLSYIGRRTRFLVCAFSLLGIVIFPFNIRESATIFTLSEFGMTYQFVNDIWSDLYIIYTVIIAINMLVVVLYTMKRGQKKRDRKLGKSMLACLITTSVGMIFDTILPLFGFGAIPGSTITQFFGTLLCYKIIKYYNSNFITVDNISKNIYYSVNAPTLVFDENGTLTIVSKSARQLLGITRDDYKNFKLRDIFTTPSTVNTNQNKYSFDSKCKFNESFCNIEVNKILDEFGDEIGQIVAITDLTERNKIIRQLEEERIKADQANIAKGQFLANMSHEIRTPINTVLGMNEMILRETNDRNIINYASNIMQSGEALLTIINDILDFSKIDNGMLDIIPEEYFLTDMVKKLMGMHNIKAENKGLKMVYDISEDLPNHLFGDEIRLRQVVTNLMSNAVKYTERGSVTLHIGGELINDRQVRLTIDVIDTGIGIKEDDIKNLFVSFKRIEENRNKHIEGTGLGMNIVKKIVDLMHGELNITSKYGVGSTFSVSFVQDLMGNETFGKVEDILVSSDLQKQYQVSFTAPEAKILIVDDNKMNLEVIKGLIKKTLIQADYAMSGVECLAAVRHMKYDMILLDHMMPIMDGIETLARLKSQDENESRSATVIALTANAIHGAREQYLDIGFDDYLSKPIDSKALEEMFITYLPQELVTISEETSKETKTSLVKEAGILCSYLLPYGIDLHKASKYCNSLDMFTICAKTFYETHDEMLNTLNAFYEDSSEENLMNYRIIAHAIKANAKTLGNQELFEAAYMHEHRSARGDITYLLVTKDSFIRLINKMCEGIAEYLIEFKEEVSETEKLHISKVDFDKKVYEIIEQIELFEDEEALTRLKELLHYQLEDSALDIINKAIGKIEQFDYDQAGELLASINS